MNKLSLRKEMKQIRCCLDHVDERARFAAQKVIQDSFFQSSELIMLYHPVRSEMPVHPIASYARKSGKLTALPVVTDSGLMEFRIWNDQTVLRPGSYGIMEPAEGDFIIPESARTLIIAPGLAFDREGYRLGYGGGFYDRYLKKHSVMVYGLCFEEQMISALPHENTDVRMEKVFTDSGWNLEF